MLKNIGFTSMGDIAIAPKEKKIVVIDGKTYPVKQVPNNSLLCKTTAQTYKDVVIINGKEYATTTVNDWTALDKTKQVVLIDGKQYDVENEALANLKTGIQSLDIKV